jgi:hypothetical protein
MALVLTDLALGIASIAIYRMVSRAAAYTVQESGEIGADLEAALAGFAVMRAVLAVLIAGFFVAGIGALSLSRIGWRAHVAWSSLLSLSLAGLPYGGPTLVYLLRRATRERFSARRGAREPPPPPVSSS